MLCTLWLEKLTVPIHPFASLHPTTSEDKPSYFDALIYIGRFQPFHNAHLEVTQIALTHTRRLIIVIGSAQDERTLKNPFTFAERQHMIMHSLSTVQRSQVECIPMIDFYNDHKWVTAIHQAIEQITEPNQRIGLIGHFKDESSYYLRLFPLWTLVELQVLQHALSATPVREAYFQGRIEREHLPDATVSVMEHFQLTTDYRQLALQFAVQPSAH